MSLLTRCPACATVYKVVPDQLRISQGWVKCGQCGDIFNGSEHLVQVSMDSQVLEPILSEVPTVGHVEGEAAPDAHGDVLDESGPLTMDGQLAPVAEAETGSAELDSQSSGQATASEDDDLNQLSFLRRADPRSVWHHAAVKAALLLVAILLGLGLGAQWVYQERDRLAASRSEFRPALQALCDILHCSIRPLQQVEFIVIDSAAFNKIGSDRYRLSFTIRNSANLALALPSIELTLTDFQDRAVVRRVLSPKQLFASSDSLAATSDWPLTVTLGVKSEVSLPDVAGYRLLAFYP